MATDRQSLRETENDQPFRERQPIAHLLCVTCDTVVVVTVKIPRVDRLHTKNQKKEPKVDLFFFQAPFV